MMKVIWLCCLISLIFSKKSEVTFLFSKKTSDLNQNVVGANGKSETNNFSFYLPASSGNGTILQTGRYTINYPLSRSLNFVNENYFFYFFLFFNLIKNTFKFQMTF